MTRNGRYSCEVENDLKLVEMAECLARSCEAMTVFGRRCLTGAAVIVAKRRQERRKVDISFPFSIVKKKKNLSDSDAKRIPSR